MHGANQQVVGFFGLREQPFAATADPLYFFATRRHKECLFRLWNCIDDRQGISVVLGNYGTGKTTLLRKVLTSMTNAPHHYNPAIVNSPIPSWTSFALLETIAAKFKLRPRERSFGAFMEALHTYLVQERNRTTTLIIDDAQNLNKRGQLELLRLAQNLETAQHKLLNLVFFAQLEWIPVLRAAPNFLQRVSMTYTLGPVAEEEVYNFITFRLRQAGAGDRAPRFDDGAVRAIYAVSKGSPRVIVTICRNALMLASHLRTRVITQSIVLHTVQRTMLPDFDMASGVNQNSGQPMQSSATENDLHETMPLFEEDRSSAAVLNSNQARANRMLLRTARTTARDDLLREAL
jgi:general secretion pathway protein A